MKRSPRITITSLLYNYITITFYNYIVQLQLHFTNTFYNCFWKFLQDIEVVGNSQFYFHECLQICERCESFVLWSVYSQPSIIIGKQVSGTVEQFYYQY